MLKPGLYEEVINNSLDESISELASDLVKIEDIDEGESHHVLSEHLKHLISSALAGISGQNQVKKQVLLCNSIIKQLYQHDYNSEDMLIQSSGKRLLSVTGPNISHSQRPDTPLARSCILTGTRLDPSFESQIKKEILTASKIDILCSFIKWSGIRILQDELNEFTHRPDTMLRIITTSYLGATDLRAIEFLRILPNTEIKVSYDTDRTRLHAKAYTFYRNTGYGTAYIGSSNLSRPALTEGLEWNVKISQSESTHLWEKASAAFETYWNDNEFVSYSEAETPRLCEALDRQRGSTGNVGFSVNFDLHPYPFQKEILDQLAAERYIQGRNRHLVVAATGTGKTMIAAFDYKYWCGKETAKRPKLLYVVHREEILKQSLGTFQAVMRDQNFGDLWVGSYTPNNMDHLFVSIQTYNSQRLWEGIPADYYDYVVVDEFHRTGATWYDRFLEHVKPGCLLGLTATPERSDGIDILRYFDGHMSAEIRLPDAVNRKLLCPFQYFGVSDTVDLNGFSWQRGGYKDKDLSEAYTGNIQRSDLVLQKVTEILLDVRQARGLGFCVNIEHAKFMAEQFQAKGIPAEALTSQTEQEYRMHAQERLRTREINFIFTVDLYNEGIDIPEIDTVLFLRPTESLTVFLQQFGRGLRNCDGKDYLTVLDFIGQAHQKYRFDVRYRALVDDPSRSITDQIDQGFPYLPAGCSVHLERKAKGYILDNIRQNLQRTRSYLVQEITDLVENTGSVPTLGEFLEFYRLEPEDIYKKGVSWSRLCFEAGVLTNINDPDEKRLTTGLRRIQHISGLDQIKKLISLLATESSLPDDVELDDITKRQLLMMNFSLWGKDYKLCSIVDGFNRLKSNPTYCNEFVQLLNHKFNHIDAVPPEIELPFACSLTMHATYTTDEILAAMGHYRIDYHPQLREGVFHIKPLKTDIFLITLDKTDNEYSSTTMYEDYAISETRFHWQSQSTISAESPTGQRYINHGKLGHTILLFVREHKEKNNLSVPYHFLGPVDYVSHLGSRPINFVWELRQPMPTKLLRKTARAVVS